MKNNNHEQKIKGTINKLLDMFESGEMPEAIAKTMIKKTGKEVPSDSWSLGNRIIMYVNNTIDARGFKQWEKVGRKIKKGSKAFYILAPMIKKIEKENEEGEIEEKTIIFGFRTIPVFRVEDTEGNPIEYPEYSPKQLPPLYEVAEMLGIDVKYMPFIGKAWGSFSSKAKTIKLHTHDVDTFFHELGHAVHNTFKPLKGGQHKEQEIVAEMVAATLCEMYGYKGYILDCYKYIKHYSNTKTPKETIKEVMKVLNEVETVVNKIFELSHQAKSEKLA